jgi:2-oxoglutarate dehydrogenase E1 component
MDRFSYLSNADVAAIDQLYQAYVADPASVDTQWARFFEGFDFARTSYPLHPNGSNGTATASAGSVDARQVSKEIGVLNLIAAYRSRGHLFAQINPILPRPDYKPDLNLEQFGLGEADLDTAFQAGAELGLGAAGSRVTLRQIIEHLKQTYCGPIGVEYLYIRNPPIIKWLQARMEPTRFTAEFKPEEKKQILRKLGQASTFEGFIHRMFVGQKRFSLERNLDQFPRLRAKRHGDHGHDLERSPWLCAATPSAIHIFGKCGFLSNRCQKFACVAQAVK